jgi:two-component system nitrate/nitrite response regulator NarL
MPRTRNDTRDGIRAIIVDDQRLFRLGLRIYLADAMPELEIVGEADSGGDGVALARAEKPDLVLLDASLSDQATEQVIQELRQAAPEANLVLFASARNQGDLALALTARVDGYLLKAIEPEKLVEGLREVVQGVVWTQPDLAMSRYEEAGPIAHPHRLLPERVQPLTPRQLDVLRLIARGLRNPEIARRLHISDETVKTHVTSLLRKLGVRSRVQAATYAARCGLLEG